MTFTQNIEYKTIDLFRCFFQAASEDCVKAQVSYRFMLSNYQLGVAKGRLSDVAAIIKLKNPSLLQQIQKGAILTQQNKYYAMGGTQGDTFGKYTQAKVLQS